MIYIRCAWGQMRISAPTRSFLSFSASSKKKLQIISWIVKAVNSPGLTNENTSKEKCIGTCELQCRLAFWSSAMLIHYLVLNQAAKYLDHASLPILYTCIRLLIFNFASHKQMFNSQHDLDFAELTPQSQSSPLLSPHPK